MKYRVDFVTNSSSSSSVIIQVKSKSKVVHTISYDIDILTESLNGAEKSYQSIIDTLINSEMIGVICNNNLISQGFVEISGLKDVHLFEDKISDYLKENQDYIVEILKKLLEFKKIRQKSVETFDDFIKHPYWDIIGVNSTSIEKIKESLSISGDDVTENIKTELDLKNLRVQKEKISEEQTYFDEDDEEDFYDDDFESEIDENDKKVEVVSSTKKATKTAKASNPTKKATKAKENQTATKKKGISISKSQKFTQNELKLIEYINRFDKYKSHDNELIKSIYKNYSKVEKLLDLVGAEKRDSIVFDAAYYLYKSRLIDDDDCKNISNIIGYGSLLNLYNNGLLSIQDSTMLDIVKMDFLASFRNAKTFLCLANKFVNDDEMIIEKLNLLAVSKVEFSENDLKDIIKNINSKREYLYSYRKQEDTLIKKGVMSLYFDFEPYMSEFDKLFEMIEEKTIYKGLPRLYKGPAYVSSTKSGCYIATSLYGSYDHPEVIVLRKYRDLELKNSYLGRLFIQIYYKISPILVKQFGESRTFKLVFGSIIRTIINSLKKNGY